MNKYYSLLLIFIIKLVIASSYFDSNQCFILYDQNTHKVVKIYNKKECLTRYSPMSTFKIPLSLIAFDQQIINQSSLFHNAESVKPLSGFTQDQNQLKNWQQDQTPNTWLKFSVVWVSRQLTNKLGVKTIKKYLQNFNYGNHDFHSKADSLNKAWLDSSLKISPMEQVNFLDNMLQHRLSVSNTAIDNTESNMFLQKLNNGWNLYGKTGSGGTKLNQHGWFIGFITKGNNKYIVVTHIRKLSVPSGEIQGGVVCKQTAIKWLEDNLH